jgi:S1-C subfamily serine protease
MNGDMIGMNTAILSQSGTSSGVGFAIPAPLVKRVVETALAGGTVAEARPWLGLKTQEVTADIARSLGLDRPEGVLITDVYPDGPGDRAGLKQGDLVLSVDDQPVGDEASLNYRVATRGAGDSVAIVVRGDKGQTRTVMVRLAPPPGGAGESRVIDGRNPLNGATVSSLTPQAAEQMGLDPFAARDGVVVSKAGEGVAARLGLQDGDIIHAVNGQTIHSLHDLETILSANAGNGAWQLVIQRGGQTITAQLRL